MVVAIVKARTAPRGLSSISRARRIHENTQSRNQVALPASGRYTGKGYMVAVALTFMCASLACADSTHRDHHFGIPLTR